MQNANMNFNGAESAGSQSTMSSQPSADQAGQRRRMMLANMLQQGGRGTANQDNPYGSFADAFNQQMMNHQMYGDQSKAAVSQTDPQNANRARLDQYYSSPNSRAGYTPDGGAQQAQSVMGRYGRPGGGSEAGYSLSSGSRPAGMMGRMGNQLQGAASSLGKGAASLGSSAMKAMSAF